MQKEYGTQIGKKFAPDGTALLYPGNTIIADVDPGNPAYDVMTSCLQLLKASPLSGLFIHLPEDSYHMTVIRGINDRVREEAFWPETLPADVPMAEADAYMHQAVGQVPSPGTIRMRFDEAVITAEDFRIRLKPADDGQLQVLRAYRDAVADAIGLRLPGHDAYTFHMTLAYTWYLPDETQQHQLSELVRQMNGLLAAQEQVMIDPPHFAWYQDMMSFSKKPIPRD